MAYKELDQLSLDVIQCMKDGFGCHYGAWKATQDPVRIEKNGIPEGWNVCVYCGTAFKPTTKRKQLYCGAWCQRQVSFKRWEQRKMEQRRAENGWTKVDGC